MLPNIAKNVLLNNKMTPLPNVAKKLLETLKRKKRFLAAQKKPHGGANLDPDWADDNTLSGKVSPYEADNARRVKREGKTNHDYDGRELSMEEIRNLIYDAQKKYRNL